MYFFYIFKISHVTEVIYDTLKQIKWNVHFSVSKTIKYKTLQNTLGSKPIWFLDISCEKIFNIREYYFWLRIKGTKPSEGSLTQSKGFISSAHSGEQHHVKKLNSRLWPKILHALCNIDYMYCHCKDISQQVCLIKGVYFVFNLFHLPEVFSSSIESSMSHIMMCNVPS